jgi:hypothetical protein
VYAHVFVHMCTWTGMCGGLVLHMAGVLDTVIIFGLIDTDRGR